MKKIDPIKLEVIRHAFIAAAEEMKTNIYITLVILVRFMKY